MNFKNLFTIIAFLVVINEINAETAEKTWKEIVPKGLVTRSGFEYVKNDPKLPNVYIYGDSISIGYTPGVRKNLAGKANVYRHYRNGNSSNTVIKCFKYQEARMRDKKLRDPWMFKWDIIAINVGLHDLKYMKDKELTFDGGSQVNPIGQYRKNLVVIFDFFKKTQPQAKLIFVATTPVPADSKGRKQGDAARYNAVALEVLKNYPEVQVCDLYAATLLNQSKWWVKPGNVHFNAIGRKAQADIVSKAIEKTLNDTGK